jgi:hypothetical protein
LIADLRAGATATAEVLARAFAEGSTLRREDLAFLREVAARRVHQGISLEEFLHAYRVALLAIWDASAEEASRLKISREAGFGLARSAIDAIDIITTQAAEAYLREENRLRTQSGRAARDLVERLIDGQSIDPGRRHPAAPGLDPTGQLLTVVGTIQQTPLCPPQHRPLPTRTHRHQSRTRPTHLHRPRRAPLHPRDNRQRPAGLAVSRHLLCAVEKHIWRRPLRTSSAREAGMRWDRASPGGGVRPAHCASA